MNYLVTGNQGFIGKELVQYLGKETHKTNTKLGNNLYLSNPYNLINDLDFAFEKNNINGIFHLGAYSRIYLSDKNINDVLKYNINGLNIVLQYATKHTIPVVFTSTSYNFVNPYANAYAVSKLIGEELCKYYRKTHGTKVYVVRLSNVYGNLREDYPEYKLGVVDLFLKKWKHKEDYTINNSGNQTRDYIHVNDVCSNLLRIMLSGKDVDWDKNEYIPICSEQVYSVKDICSMIFDYPPTALKSISGEIESCPIKNTLNLPIKQNLKEYIQFVKDGILRKIL